MSHEHTHDHAHHHGHEHEHGHCHGEGCACGHQHGESEAGERRIVLIRIIVAAVLLVIAWLLPLQGIWRLLAFLVPYLIVGYDTLLHAVRGILHGEVFDEAFLMSVASIGALCIGEYPEAVAVMLFNQIGELFEDTAVDRSRDAIRDLMDIRPDHANVERNGQIETVSPETVQAGEILVVRPGERIPLDGEVVGGGSTLDTSSLTGESAPRSVQAGDQVMSGCVNLTDVLRVRAGGSYAESTVARILELVEEAGERKAHTESMITRFARWYTPAVCLLAVLLCVVPPLVLGQPFVDWLHRALIFLVISCPCALVLSVPLTFYAGVGCASKNGVLIKGSNLLETLCDCDTVVFDKTGTLTRGQFAVTSVHAVGVAEETLLYLAAHAEGYSSHPIAQAVRAAYGRPLENAKITEAHEEAGCGIEATVDGRKIALGNARLMERVTGAVPEAVSDGCVYAAVDGAYAGYLLVEDAVKSGSAAAVSELRALGVRQTVMLTGDRGDTARRVAEQVGVDAVYDSLLPQEKVQHVEQLLQQKQKGALVFVGDGVNDAPVLARADIGVAMGALGSDAAVEAADVVLMDDDPVKLPLAIRIARRTKRIAWQNIVFALGVKLLILLLGALGLAGMWAAVFADVGVSVLAVLNATRAMNIK